MKKIIEVVFCESDDRFVYIRRNWHGEIIELNFMQGDCEDSFNRCQKNDAKLMRFYDFMSRYEKIETIDEINKLIWRYHELFEN